MSFTDKQTEMLNKPLSTEHIKTRSQSGLNLSYIEGWHAINEANRIFGFGGWSRETVEIYKVSEFQCKLKNGNDGYNVSYVSKVRITVGNIVREGCGFGSGINPDLGQAHESALKEAETDATKRALSTFGNQFGLALYDKERTNVEDPNYVKWVEERFQNAKKFIPATKTKEELNKLLNHPESKEVMNQLDEDKANELNELVDKQLAKFAENTDGKEPVNKLTIEEARNSFLEAKQLLSKFEKQDEYEDFLASKWYADLKKSIPAEGLSELKRLEKIANDNILPF